MTDPDWVTGANWPKPCKRCGSFDHTDCYQPTCDCGGPEDVNKPPIKRGELLRAVPLKRRDDND